MKRFCFSLLCMVSFTLFTPASVAAQDKSIVTLASETSDLSTLVASLKYADLVETLNGDGPFTVFAPVNAAFSTLPPGAADAFQKPENKEGLGNILKYHVVAGKITSEDLMKMFEGNGDDFDLEPLFGDEFEVEKFDGGIRISDEAGQKVNFVSTDIMASNGVVHVIDKVMLPSKDTEIENILEAVGGAVASAAGSAADMAESAAKTAVDAGETAVDAVKDAGEAVYDAAKDVVDNDRDADYNGSKSGATMTSSDYNPNSGNTVVDVAMGNNDFSTLVTAVGAAEYVDLLKGVDGVTIFAPTNDAFNALPDGTVNSLLEAGNKSQLQDILSFHVIPAEVSAAQLLEAIEGSDNQYLRLQTISGKSLYAFTEDGNVYLMDGKGNKIQVVQTDVPADNGVIHAVSGVLMPYETM